MQEIFKNGSSVGFAEAPTDIKNYLPESAPTKIEMLGGIDRVLTYGDDEYLIKHSDKQVGIYAGDVCPICRRGVMADMNGCSVCTKCSSSLKCGL